ncbi:MAG: hypothetical protein IRY95_07075, partial [Clostridia bacterium]|nr:hypothetical protein [Clostridia bacterium]
MDMGRSRWIAHVVLTLVLAGAVVTAGCGNRAPATGGGAQGAGGVAQGAGGAVSKTVKKLEIAYFLPPVIPSAKNLQWMAEEITKRSGGAIQATFHGATISTKELEIIDMVKTGTIQVGTTGGAATTVFPELSVFLLPYLFRDYDHAYKVLN